MAANHTFSVLSIIRKSRSKQHKVPIYLRITVSGKRSEISTKEYVDETKWNRTKGRVKGNSLFARQINNRLDTWETKVREHYNQFIRDEKNITALLLKNSVLGRLDKKNILQEYFDNHEKEVKAKIGIDYSRGTHKNYISTSRHLGNYLNKSFRGQVISLKDVDYDFIAGFETYLKLDADNSNNGAIKHIQRLKKVINLAIKRGDLSSNPFATYKVKNEKVNREFLSKEELTAIEEIELKNGTLRKVRDIFIFICYTGISYSDLMELTEESVTTGIDGDLWINIERKKTGMDTRIPVLPPAMAIIDRYKDHPEAVSKGTLLPMMSNQKLNQYLKEIARKCEITKPVTCHIGRHTFATTITLNNNIPIETVSKMLGHASLKTTQIYAKVLERKISNDMSKLKELYKRNPKEAIN
jgi:integrase